MVAEKEKVVSFDYTLKDDAGNELDSSEGHDPLSYLHGVGNIIPGLESALEGKSTGESLSVTVPPELAYGDRDEGLVGEIPKDQFDGIEDLAVDMQIQAETEDGPRLVTITAIEGETVTIDANHALAGMTLHFDVKLTEIRDATAEEIEHGHAHMPGGHCH